MMNPFTELPVSEEAREFFRKQTEAAEAFEAVLGDLKSAQNVKELAFTLPVALRSIYTNGAVAMSLLVGFTGAMQKDAAAKRNGGESQ